MTPKLLIRQIVVMFAIVITGVCPSISCGKIIARSGGGFQAANAIPRTAGIGRFAVGRLSKVQIAGFLQSGSSLATSGTTDSGRS